MKKISVILLGLIWIMLGCKHQPVNYLEETPEAHNARMEWWREARFGMFIHWGLYSVPAGEWKGQTHYAEWIRNNAHIPLDTYNLFVKQFNPVNFNAERWVDMAKDAGMKYIVITSKHHDGFCLFDSKYTDFDITSTPFKRDVLKELADACHKNDIKMCWYHSIMDWHHPDYLPRRSWEKDRSTEGADFNRYVTYLKNELTELLTHYGEIGVLWFDGEWESTWNSEYGKEIYQHVRALQPNIIVNNRVTVGRSGMAGTTKEKEFGGDFGTPEQQIPATGIPGYDWETCMTMNNHWGYNKFDKNFKSSKQLIRMLTDIASKGGNFLLNIGPKADGTFPHEAIERLKDIGKWMKVNGESIYGTKASPFKNLSWGRCTQKTMTGGTRLYLHVFDWPESNDLVVPGLGSKPIRAYLLADPDQQELKVTRHRDALSISLPAQPLDPWNTVVVLDIEGEPVVYDAPVISAFAPVFINDTKVEIKKGESVSTIRYTLDGSEPSVQSPKYEQPLTLKDETEVHATCFVDGEPVSSTASMHFRKVKPMTGRSLDEVKPGLMYHWYDGKWDSLPAYSGLTPKMTGVSENFSEADNSKDDNFSIDYQGFIQIPTTGVYRFYLTSDDGSRLYLNEKVLIDHDGLHGATTKSGLVALEQGLHSLRISYFEKSGNNSLKLEWASQDISKELVPSKQFYHYH